MKKLLWCSPHLPTQEQEIELRKLGSICLLKDFHPGLQDQINQCPSNRVILTGMANSLNFLLVNQGFDVLVQVGGSPLFLAIVGKNIPMENLLFAHSARVSIDVPQEDGTVLKTSVFKHLGFI